MIYHSLSMSSIVRRSFSGAVMLLTISVFSIVSYAQGTPAMSWTGMVGNEVIFGRIFFPPGDHTAARPLIRLRSSSSLELTGITDVDGSFRFTHLRPDQYTVIVDAGDAYEKASDTVLIATAGGVPAQGNPGDYAIPTVYQVHIYLKPKRLNDVAKQPDVAANTVLTDVPAAAQELFDKALEYAHAGKNLKAIELLESVIAKAPRFTLAYNELGVQFLKSGRASEAADAFKKALAITPADFTLCLNYGIALLNQKKFDDAETQLRFAIQKNAFSPMAHYYLGLTLMSERKFDIARAEFENTIKNGGEKLALVHKYLGGIYWRNNDYKQAADELEKYVKLDPKAPDAKKIRDTIKDLRNRS